MKEFNDLFDELEARAEATAIDAAATDAAIEAATEAAAEADITVGPFSDPCVDEETVGELSDGEMTDAGDLDGDEVNEAMSQPYEPACEEPVVVISEILDDDFVLDDLVEESDVEREAETELPDEDEEEEGARIEVVRKQAASVGVKQDIEADLAEAADTASETGDKKLFLSVDSLAMLPIDELNLIPVFDLE